MASPSNINTSSPTEKYPCPMEFNVLDFVPKLLSERDYEKWKILMEDFIKKQGLIGFIDDTAKEDIDNQDYYKAWKRSDDLVQGWILATLAEDIRLLALGLETAKALWTALEKKFDPTSSLRQYDEEKENRVTRYLPLHKAVVKGDWDEAMAIIQQDPAAVRAAITPHSHTALHVAIQIGGRTHFVRKLLEKMTPHDVEHLVDHTRKTALHRAAICGTIEEVEMLVNKSSTTLAINTFYWRMRKLSFLFCMLLQLTDGEHYDIALTLLERKPELARGERPPLDILVKKGSSFPSGNSFNFWHNLIYLG
ncbi:hypothetical protein RHGRI_007327 [Rhododendron griersonianum]|uniref:Ankyrin repeat-containing protein n=1 Tax=Rhododendron griersonianum TaxID=479676 RepID=A0AAV6KXQ3_9ERIC|nr:hypothetical protein RHGRI_007327 [Rhododendron griersonianum]